jgi:hypothetical protein
MFSPTTSKMYSKLINKEPKKQKTTEEIIEENKIRFNLTHGKGLRKKHKSKSKNKKR